MLALVLVLLAGCSIGPKVPFPSVPNLPSLNPVPMGEQPDSSSAVAANKSTLRLQVLMDGELVSPEDGRTVLGTPTHTYLGVPRHVAVRLVDGEGVLQTRDDVVSVASSDSGAQHPAQGRLTAGEWQFNVTFTSPGHHALTIRSDDVADVVRGHVEVLNEPHFLVQAPRLVTAGVPFDVRLVARDAKGVVMPSFTSWVYLQGGDPHHDWSRPIWFDAGDKGEKILKVTLTASFAQLISAADAYDHSLRGTSGLVVVENGAKLSLELSAPTHVQAQMPFELDVRVRAEDNSTVGAYRSTVAFGTSLEKATGFQGPGHYTFLVDDGGQKSFDVALSDPGPHFIAAGDIYILGLDGVTGPIHVVAPQEPATSQAENE